MSVWTACWQGLGLVVGALLAVFSWLWITRPRTNAPGPTPLPLLGNLPHFWRNLPVVVNDFRKLQRCYGDVFRSHQFLHAYIWPLFMLLDANELEVLNGYMEAFNEGARFLCSQLEEAKGVAIDISKMLHHTSFHVLALSLFGISVDELEPDRRKQAEFVTVSLAALELIQKRFYQPWLQIDWIISLTPDGEALKEQMTVLNGIVKKGIALLREKRLKALPKKRKTFLDVMIDDRGNFLLSENEVFDEVRTFVLAASDSTATALSCIFALLGLHPEWQDAIQKEVDEIFGTGDHYLRPAIDSDLAQLKVTEAVIKESLRLFPAVPVAPVFASEDIPLSYGRYVAPRGSVVFVFLNLLHRQPAFFPDPDKFDPRRFLVGGGAGALFPYSYLPFGAGSRLCVGARFAMLVMKTTLAMVMRQFRIVASCTREELEEIAVFITGKPVRDIRIKCIPRSAPTMKN
ncbi:cytochrome P450 4c3-like isoform X2 [Schistocerca cancellata]|uniref:cytochrome P450 4c3-like isoform X2 n=1 Tax=Schistocerca cancellata TaxID=274614 RepID=UPI002118A2E4|nr:cytochrome P450 4c3-like isoform X2 [Schistocerca cancellata]